MNAAVMRNINSDPFYSESNMRNLDKKIRDVNIGRANSISFDDEAWNKIKN